MSNKEMRIEEARKFFNVTTCDMVFFQGIANSIFKLIEIDKMLDRECVELFY